MFTERWAEVIVGNRPLEIALGEALHELGWAMGVEAALGCWFEEDLVIDQAVAEAARGWAAQGIPLALVSNQEPLRARFLEEHLAPFLPFMGTAFSGDLGATKKERAFYERAELHLGIVGGGSAVVFLDDTLENIDAARRHGWTGVHFTPDGDWRRDVTEALDRAGEAGPPS